MSNQRVVVLTDDQIWECIEAIEVSYEVNGDSDRRQEVVENYPAGKLLTMLRAALEHPEGITDEMKQRGGELLVGYTCHSEEAAEALAGEVLEAALLPGDRAGVLSYGRPGGPMRLRIEAVRALRLNYTWRGVYIWLKGRKRGGERGWQRLWREPEMVIAGQEAIAEGNFS